MIGPIDRNLNITCVEERLGLNSAGGVDIDVLAAAGTTTVISNVPCIHAREIVVFVDNRNGVGKVDHVYLGLYAGARTIAVVVDLGSVAVGASAVFQYTAGVGETYDVAIDPLANTTVRVWTCAR